MLFALCAPVTYGIGAALGAALVVLALILRVRGFKWVRFFVVGVVAIGLTGITLAAWARFIVGTAEAEGRDAQQQEAAEVSFDEAFDKAGAPPPPRMRRGGDAGADFGDDARTGPSPDGGAGRSE